MSTLLNEHVQKILYKSSYIIGEGRIDESKQTEAQALNILGSTPNASSIINHFKQADTTKNQVLLPVMAKAYTETNNEHQVTNVFGSAAEFIKSNKIDYIRLNKEGKYETNKGSFDNFLRFSEYIHGLENYEKLNTGAQQAAGKNVSELIDNNDGETPMWENDKIAVYDGNNIESCIRYGRGKLTGKNYSFCIGGYGSSNMWNSYRDNNGASFYYILDKTRKTDDPFHIVVWMPVEYHERGGHSDDIIMITHEPNNTKVEHDFDSEYAKPALGMGYRDYLKKNGVPIEKIAVRVPKTEFEKNKQNLLGKKNDDLEWFKNLGKEGQKQGIYDDLSEPQATFKLIDEYIGRGHQLSDEQFNYLLDGANNTKSAAYQLLSRYVGTGQALPHNQFNIIANDKG